MKVYKLFRMRSGKIYPLYVLASEETRMGIWLKAESGIRTESGKVKSRLGELAYRPGWHSTEIPYETHIGKKVNGKIVAIPKDLVWCECEIQTEKNYQPVADARGWNGKRVIATKAQLDFIPENGFYKYKTNPNMTGSWIISGELKVNRIISDDEVIAICHEHGLEPLPREK